MKATGWMKTTTMCRTRVGGAVACCGVVAGVAGDAVAGAAGSSPDHENDGGRQGEGGGTSDFWAAVEVPGPESRDGRRQLPPGRSGSAFCQPIEDEEEDEE